MVARVTRLIAEKFVLSTFPRALTTLSSMCSRAVRALESSPGLMINNDDGQPSFGTGRGAAGTYDIQAVRHRLLPFLVPELLIDGSKIVECPRLSYRVFLRPEYRDAAVKIGQNPSPRFVGIPWPRGRAILSWLHPIVVRRRRVPRGSPEKSARREFSKPSRRSSARALH